MDRKAYRTIEIADSEGVRTFVVCGMPSVGKTTLVLNYIKKTYEEFLYIDARFDLAFRSFFSEYTGRGDKLSLIDFFSEYFKISQEYLVNIPIILDEPSESFLKSGLFKKYMQELKLFIIVCDRNIASSLEKNVKEESSVCEVKLFPMNFGEFLVALDKEWYDEVISGHIMSKRRIPDMIHEELSDLFEIFCFTGGMPEVVEEFIKFGSTENIRQKQEKTAASVVYPLLKASSQLPADSEIAPYKIEAILEAVEDILKKDNHKFMYSSIRDGATKRQYEPAMDHLCANDIVFKVSSLSKDDYRAYLSDIGLYRGEIGKRSLESLVLQEIRSSGLDIKYWESGKGASVSMIIEGASGLVPIELKQDKSNIRSVKAFLKELGASYYLRFAEENIKAEHDYISVPFYAAYTIDKLLK